MKFESIGNAAKQVGVAYLGGVNASAKLEKNLKVGQYTYGLYLAPAMTSGFNVCEGSTPECRLGCLATSGRAGMELLAGKVKTQNSRIKKTRLFFEQPVFFMQWLIAELSFYQAKAKKDGYGFSARLNCTSDIDWANVRFQGKNIFEIFPDVNFYDYTKIPTKFFNKPENYHLTFSYTGKNWGVCEKLLNKGNSIAVVFNVKNELGLPETFNGFKVVNGDLTDYRPNDGKGVIIGLKWKRIADKINEKQILNSCFVVNPLTYVQPKKVNVHELVLA